MVKKFEINSVNFDKLPNIEKCNKLLDVIHKKVKPSLSEVSCKVDKPIIIYGAGNLGKMAKEYLNKLNIKPLFIIDRNFEKCNEDLFWRNGEILDPCEVPYIARKLNKVIVCVVTTSFCEIKRWLNILGFEDVVPFYDITLSYQDKHPLNNGWFDCLLNNEDIENMKYVLSKLEDDISRAHYLQFIAWHVCREEWIFANAPIIHKEKYFIPEIVNVLTDKERFINIGAYDGEFTLKFMEKVNNKFSVIYAFEPDKDNIDKFLYNLKNYMNNYNIHLIPKALGKIEEKKKFYGEIKYVSQLSELGNKEIEVYKLDNFNLSPTIVKIHVEGLENEIFDGGLDTIINKRPILMMTVYHNRNGLWNIQKNVMESLGNSYIYYFRLHLWCGTSGIIYAIPKERLK